MRKKGIDGAYVTQPGVEYTSERRRIDGEYRGYSSLICFLEGTKRLVVNENGTDLCLSDAGYRWLNYLPDDENWCLTAMYDRQGETIEWYFDVTKSNFIEDGVPCMDDLYLDIVVLPNGEITILDEDELNEALINGEISDEEFQFAQRICDQLMDSGMLAPGYLSSLCNKLLSDYDSPAGSPGFPVTPC